MTTFVLVHGAFHGAWCWVKLTPELEARGHHVIAPDMPGSGEDRTPLGEVTLQGCVQRIHGSIVRGATEPVVLVGHSLGAMAVSSFTEQYPEKLRRLVFLAGLIPRDGDSLQSLIAGMKDPDQPQAAAPPADSWEGVSQPPPLDQVGDRFYNDCSAADIAYAVAHLRPQANAPRLAVVHLTPARFCRVPRSFIGCAGDRAMPLYRQRQTVVDTQCDHVLSLPTGHSPFFSAPAALADMLSGLD